MDRIVTLAADATPGRPRAGRRPAGFSRYVLVDADGEPTGYLHLKDVLDLDDGRGRPARADTKFVRQLISVFAEAELEDALAAMRRGGHHLARVLDKDGVTRGILFLEDVIEELVGEVRDATRR